MREPERQPLATLAKSPRAVEPQYLWRRRRTNGRRSDLARSRWVGRPAGLSHRHRVARSGTAQWRSSTLARLNSSALGVVVNPRARLIDGGARSAADMEAIGNECPGFHRLVFCSHLGLARFRYRG